jgi:MoxR-like ATPase
MDFHPNQSEQQDFTTAVQHAAIQVFSELNKVLSGQEAMVQLMLAGLFCNGHVLIEGVPGLAKTLSARLLARALDLHSTRIQFTPDLMPADVTGSMVYQLRDSVFTFKPGPVFANLVIIDEINRAPAKTQAALFEVMEEQQVSADGKTYPMPQPFMIVATQNPIEQEGTYRLPEAQLDRFLFRILVSYPNADDEFTMLSRFHGDFSGSLQHTLEAVLDEETLIRCRKAVAQVHVEDKLLRYVAQAMEASRKHPDLYLGASPRAGLALVRASKAAAAMEGRTYITPDDIRSMAGPVLNHRLILKPESDMDGVLLEDVIEALFRSIEVPR